MRIGLISDTHMPGSLRELWPQNKQLRYGTIGFVEIGDDRITASIHQLTQQGLEDHKTIKPQTASF